MRWLLVVALLLAGCKKPPAAAAHVGWQKEASWAGECFYPKDFAALGAGDRRLARQDALEQMLSQWKGERNDGVSFEEKISEGVETVLLGRPEAIEGVAAKNAEMCEKFRKTGDLQAWGDWLVQAANELTAGDCYSQLYDAEGMFNYLDIGKPWQMPIKVCQDKAVQVSASAIDYYRITDKGPWINAAGDETQPTISKTDWPCDVEGCVAGMVIMRFTGESGVVQVHPVGLQIEFNPPEHGTIEVQINDTTWFDNKYKIESGLEHHTAITWKPL